MVIKIVNAAENGYGAGASYASVHVTRRVHVYTAITRHGMQVVSSNGGGVLLLKVVMRNPFNLCVCACV